MRLVLNLVFVLLAFATTRSPVRGCFVPLDKTSTTQKPTATTRAAATAAAAGRSGKTQKLDDLVRTARRGDPRNKYYMDVFLKMSDKTCGMQKPIKDWEVNNDLLVNHRFIGVQNLQDKYFKAGVFRVPITGMYHCCASARCKKGGSCKLSITKNGDKDVRGTFGSDLTKTEATSMSTCLNEVLLQGDTLQVNLDSQEATSCLEETGERFNRFNCMLYTTFVYK